MACAILHSGSKVTFIDAATAGAAASKNAVTCNVPSTINANWLIAFTFNDGSTQSMTDDAGTWTNSNEQNGSLNGNSSNLRAHYRTIASEPASYDWDRGATSCRKLVATISLGSVNTSDPIEEDSVSTDEFVGTTDTAGADLTSPTMDADVYYKIVAFAVMGSSSDPTVSTPPSGWTELASVGITGGDGMLLLVYGQKTADTSATVTMSSASDDGHSLGGMIHSDSEP